MTMACTAGWDKWLQTFQSIDSAWIQEALGIYCVLDPVLGTGIQLCTQQTTFLPAKHLHSSRCWATFSAFEYSILNNPHLALCMLTFSNHFCRLGLDLDTPANKSNVTAVACRHNQGLRLSLCSVGALIYQKGSEI